MITTLASKLDTLNACRNCISALSVIDNIEEKAVHGTWDSVEDTPEWFSDFHLDGLHLARSVLLNELQGCIESLHCTAMDESAVINFSGGES